MEFIFNGKVTFSDYKQFNRTYSNRGFIKYFRIVLYSGLIIFIGFTIFPEKDIFLDIFKKSPAEFIKLFIPLIFLILFIIIFNKIIMPLIYKRHYNGNKMLQYTQNIKINENNITISTDNSNTVYQKSDINKILYDKDSVYIFIGINIGNIIKKRFLENENDFDTFKQFIKDNYGKK